MKLIDALRTPALLAYIRNYQGNTYLGELLFPKRDINELSYKYVIGARRRPVMAHVTSFNAEASIASRTGGSLKEGKILPIKRKIALDEELMIKLYTPRPQSSEFEDAIAEIYNDQALMVEAVKARIEKMRMDAIITGKVDLAEDGILLSIDFGYKAGQKATLVGSQMWSDLVNSNPINDMLNWKQAIIDNGGVVSGRSMTSNKVVAYLLQNVSIRKMIHGDNGGAQPITRTQLDLLLEQFELPPIVTNEDTYDAEAADGTLTTTRYFAENRFVMMPGEKLGDTLYAPTAEALKKVRAGEITFGDAKGIFGEVYETDEPPAHWTKAAAIAFPTFPMADSVFTAQVLA